MSVIGQTTGVPWKSVVLVYTKWADGSASTGSGAVVGDNDVLTAAHCVYRGGVGYAREVYVTPGYNYGRSPLGAFRAVSIQGNRIDEDGNGLIGYGEMRNDVAVLGFRQNLASITGKMSLDHSFYTGSTNATGYPGVYRGGMVNDIANTDYDMRSGFINIREHSVYSGNSGGPIWHGSTSNPEVAGVVSTRVAAADVGTNYRSITTWMRQNDHNYNGSKTPDRPVYTSEVLTEAVTANAMGSAGGNAKVVKGTDADDTFFAAQGFELAIGGEGTDTVIVGLRSSEVSIYQFGEGARLDMPGQKIVIFDIEKVIFSDKIVDIERDPGSLISTNIGFDADFYLQQNPDVAELDVDPWTHFRQQGWKEDRDPNPFFDVSWYIAQNPESAEDGGNPMTHYLDEGIFNGADPSATISTAMMLSLGSDLV